MIPDDDEDDEYRGSHPRCYDVGLCLKRESGEDATQMAEVMGLRAGVFECLVG
jgi:hypothetical protein